MSRFKIGDRILIEVEITYDEADYGGYHVQLPHITRESNYNPEEEDWYVLPHQIHGLSEKVTEE